MTCRSDYCKSDLDQQEVETYVRNLVGSLALRLFYIFIAVQDLKKGAYKSLIEASQ